MHCDAKKFHERDAFDVHYRFLMYVHAMIENFESN